MEHIFQDMENAGLAPPGLLLRAYDNRLEVALTNLCAEEPSIVADVRLQDTHLAIQGPA